MIIKHRAFIVDKNPKYDGYQIVLASAVFKFFVKKISGSGVNNEIKQNEQLAEEWHKPIIKKNLKKHNLFFI